MRAAKPSSGRRTAPSTASSSSPASNAGARFRRSRLRFPLAAVFLYVGVWLLLDVGFIAHRFPSPFLFGAAFYRRYARAVGGPAEYAAGFFVQALSRHWAGVLAFSLLALAAWAIARSILRRFSAGTWSWPAVAFPLVILILASRDIAVSFVLPMLGGLAAASFYMTLRERLRDGWPRALAVVLGLVASIPLYWVLASGSLYLCAMCALYELLVRKRPAPGLAWLAFGAAVPYGMSAVLFEPDVAERYLRWLTMPPLDAPTTSLIAAMYLFVPLGALVVFLLARFRVGARLTPRIRRAAQAVGFAALVLLASRLVALRFDTSGWLHADYLLDDGRPAEALAALARSPDDGDPVRFLTFYALARTGRLPWDMFRYPQLASSEELLLRSTTWDTNPAIAEWRSDMYLELGRVNEAQRWAHEALSMEGETPRVLERMALTYVLNDNPAVARTFLRALEKVPFQRGRAQDYLAALDRDPGMASDPRVARIRPLMLRKDLVGDWSTEQILQQCLEANPSNRMAFEYLLAHYLLTSDMKGLADLAPRLKEFYPELPTHVQEALLGYRNANDSLPPGVDAAAIDRQIESRFQVFVQVYSKYRNGSPEECWKALAPDFGTTYWFFYIFGHTTAGPPPQPGSDGTQGTASSR
jgi:hypothetical protein